MAESDSSKRVKSDLEKTKEKTREKDEEKQEGVLPVVAVTPQEQTYRNEFANANVLKDFPELMKCTKCQINLKMIIKTGKEFCCHPILKVLMCTACNDFYGDGYFSLDEDAEDKYCRWCGEGGKLFICSKCIYGFCPKCIKTHFGNARVKEVKEDDDWLCYICNPQPLWKLRLVCELSQNLAQSVKEKATESTTPATRRSRKTGLSSTNERGSSTPKKRSLTKRRKTESLTSEAGEQKASPKKRTTRSFTKKVAAAAEAASKAPATTSESSDIEPGKGHLRSLPKRRKYSSSKITGGVPMHETPTRRPSRRRYPATTRVVLRDSSDSDLGDEDDDMQEPGPSRRRRRRTLDRLTQHLKDIVKIAEVTSQISLNMCVKKMRKIDILSNTMTREQLAEETQQLRSVIILMSSSLTTANKLLTMFESKVGVPVNPRSKPRFTEDTVIMKALGKLLRGNVVKPSLLIELLTNLLSLYSRDESHDNVSGNVVPCEGSPGEGDSGDSEAGKRGINVMEVEDEEVYHGEKESEESEESHKEDEVEEEEEQQDKEVEVEEEEEEQQDKEVEEEEEEEQQDKEVVEEEEEEEEEQQDKEVEEEEEEEEQQDKEDVDEEEEEQQDKEDEDEEEEQQEGSPDLNNDNDGAGGAETKDGRGYAESSRDRSPLSDNDGSDRSDRDRSPLSDNDGSDRSDRDRSPLSDNEGSDRSDRDRSPHSDNEGSDRSDKDRSTHSDNEGSDRSDKDHSTQSDKEHTAQSDKEETAQSDKEDTPHSDKEDSAQYDKDCPPHSDKDYSPHPDKDHAVHSDSDFRAIPDNDLTTLEALKEQLLRSSSDEETKEYSGDEEEEFVSDVSSLSLKSRRERSRRSRSVERERRERKERKERKEKDSEVDSDDREVAALTNLSSLERRRSSMRRESGSEESYLEIDERSVTESENDENDEDQENIQPPQNAENDEDQENIQPPQNAENDENQENIQPPQNAENDEDQENIQPQNAENDEDQENAKAPQNAEGEEEDARPSPVKIKSFSEEDTVPYDESTYLRGNASMLKDIILNTTDSSEPEVPAESEERGTEERGVEQVVTAGKVRSDQRSQGRERPAKRKSSWRNDPLLRGSLTGSPTDLSSEEMKARWMIKKMRLETRTRKEMSKESDAEDPELVNEDDIETEVYESPDSESWSSGLNMTKKKKTKYMGKLVSSSADEILSSSSEVECLSQDVSPKKHRKKIKKILKKESLHLETKQAVKAENDRKKRMAARNEIYQQFYPNFPNDRRLVLDFDQKTGEAVVEAPKGLVRKLKPHQKEGIKFMWDCCFESVETLEESNGSGCILAHCMGLGKTLQVITLVCTVMNYDLGVKAVLIVCPLNVVTNWLQEFEYWMQDAGASIATYSIHNYKKKYERLFQIEEWSRNGGVMVISYDMMRNLTCPRMNSKDKFDFSPFLLDPGPDLVICDEGHLLKNEDTSLSKCMRRMKTSRRVVLTGTPLQNNLTEYHSMIQFIKPNILGTKKEFMNRFGNPIINGQFEDSTASDVKLMRVRAHVLHKLLDGCIQRFNYSVLTPFLPEKHEYVISIRLTEKQSRIYKHYINEFAKKSTLSQKNAKLFNDFHWLQKIWTHPLTMTAHLERGRMTSGREGSDRDEGGSASEGSVIFLGGNSDGSTKREFWREVLAPNDFEDLRSSNKLIVLFSILKRCKDVGDKVLVFSQSLYNLNLIEYFLKKVHSAYESRQECIPAEFRDKWVAGIDYFRMDGSTSSETRRKWCRSFNRISNTRSRLFLISTKAGGLGINLVAANRVVIFDVSWNPSHDVQSIFRVYRFGQKKVCYIYRLFSEATMEEKIYERQVTKLSMEKRILDEQQIERHYGMGSLHLYKFEPLPRDRWSVPKLPKDVLLAEILNDHRDLIVSYHEHDSLLENKEEEELTEEERRAAWDDFEKDRFTTTGPESHSRQEVGSCFRYRGDGLSAPVMHHPGNAPHSFTWRPFETERTTSKKARFADSMIPRPVHEIAASNPGPSHRFLPTDFPFQLPPPGPVFTHFVPRFNQ